MATDQIKASEYPYVGKTLAADVPAGYHLSIVTTKQPLSNKDSFFMNPSKSSVRFILKIEDIEPNLVMTNEEEGREVNTQQDDVNPSETYKCE